MVYQSNLTGAYDVRADFDPRYGVWMLIRLVCPDGGKPKWKPLFESGIGPYGKIITFGQDQEAAENAAEKCRRSLGFNVDFERLHECGTTSQSLKISKAVVSRKRLKEEEALMHREAIRRHEKDLRIPEEKISVPPKLQKYRDEIISKTREMPYLRTMMVGMGGSRRVFTSDDGVCWDAAFYGYTLQESKIAYRAEISEGFGISSLNNWSTTKAKIRRMLLPRVNQLLMLASVRKMLDEALAEGKRALVLNNFVFWYEPDGNVGWEVKEVGAPKGHGDDAATWEAGKIISKNHGRIVVLPYTKKNGEYVDGYTKNSAGDGPALPRHPNEYVEIGFHRLEGDAMIKLMGELPYE